MTADPIDTVQWLPAAEVHPNEWNPNRVMRPELRLLERSLLLTGWVQPLLVAQRCQGGDLDHDHDPRPPECSGYLIVDGYHRWRLSLESPAVRQRWGGLVPCAVLDLDRASAMLLTVRINRAKGAHGSVAMSALVRALVHEEGVSEERICDDLGAGPEEVALLLAEGVLKARKAEQWSYSKAWHPVEDGRSASQSARDKKAADAKAAGVPDA